MNDSSPTNPWYPDSVRACIMPFQLTVSRPGIPRWLSLMWKYVEVNEIRDDGAGALYSTFHSR